MSWWKEGVFYQVYPRSFKDSNGDGIGDLHGITQKLDYLSWLGVDAIWISPFFKSPMVDFGYDVSDYVDIDPIFGTLSDFDELLQESHRRGIKVVIDQVYNHTSDKHPWFMESKRSRDNSKADWYIWRDPKPNGAPPNNWVSFFSGEEPESAWEWDKNRKQYYLHLFAKEQPDLNWRNPEVKKAVFDSIRFWLDRGVDGFRFDVVSLYYKDPKFRDAIKRPNKKESHKARDDYYFDRFCERPETILAVEEIRELMDSYNQKVSIGEVVTEKEQYGYLDFVNDGRLNLAFNFDFMKNVSLDPLKIKKLVERTERIFETRAWPCYVLGNHDSHRVISRLTKNMNMNVSEDEKKMISKLLATLLLTLRGTPFIYYGEEIGMENTDIPYEKIVDPEGKNLWPKAQGRDVCRTPMQWDNTEYVGFSTTEPWLPVNSNKLWVNVEDEMKDPNSVLNYYKSLLQIRKGFAALRRGEIEFLDSPDGILEYIRRRNSEKVLVILNFTNSQIRTPVEFNGKVILRTYRKGDEEIHHEVNLEPFESIVAKIL